MPRRSPFVTRPGWGRSAASVRKRERDRKRRWLAGNQTDALPDHMAVLVDPNDGLALQAPTGESWVQWIEITVLVDPNDGLALQTPTGEAWVQWITIETETNND